jgi:hypothetical protein
LGGIRVDQSAVVNFFVPTFSFFFIPPHFPGVRAQGDETWPARVEHWLSVNPVPPEQAASFLREIQSGRVGRAAVVDKE